MAKQLAESTNVSSVPSESPTTTTTSPTTIHADEQQRNFGQKLESPTLSTDTTDGVGGGAEGVLDVTDHGVMDEELSCDHSRDNFLVKLKQFSMFLGPAVLISVGYVDPGNCMTY